MVRHPEVAANGSDPKWPARWQAPRPSKDAAEAYAPSSFEAPPDQIGGSHLRMTETVFASRFERRATLYAHESRDGMKGRRTAIASAARGNGHGEPGNCQNLPPDRFNFAPSLESNRSYRVGENMKCGIS